MWAAEMPPQPISARDAIRSRRSYGALPAASRAPAALAPSGLGLQMRLPQPAGRETWCQQLPDLRDKPRQPPFVPPLPGLRRRPWNPPVGGCWPSCA
jgi:hypothetical protein